VLPLGLTGEPWQRVGFLRSPALRSPPIQGNNPFDSRRPAPSRPGFRPASCYLSERKVNPMSASKPAHPSRPASARLVSLERIALAQQALIEKSGDPPGWLPGIGRLPQSAGVSPAFLAPPATPPGRNSIGSKRFASSRRTNPFLWANPMKKHHLTISGTNPIKPEMEPPPVPAPAGGQPGLWTDAYPNGRPPGNAIARSADDSKKGV
jgi:hypothetical protein